MKLSIVLFSWWCLQIISLAFQIVRINTKYNVIYVLGQSVPGGTNGVVYLHDTILPLKWHKDKGPANFPTFMPTQLDENGLPEDIFEDSIHQFAEPSITFVDDEVKDPKKK
jgi:large subunit ribosomal protein L3